MRASMFEQAVLPLFEEYRGDWLVEARRVARALGTQGPVTIDDVRARVPPPSHVDPRVMGAVFTRREWERVGYQSSTRSTCHKRPICLFRLKEGST